MHRAHKRRAMKHTPAQCTALMCAQPDGQHWNATHAAFLWLPRAAHAPSRGRYHVHHSLHQRAGDSTAVPKGPVVTWATTRMATIRSLGHLLRHTTPPTGRRHPHTHVRRRVFGQVPSSCCSPPPPVKAGRAPSRALIRRAQRDRRVPRQLVGAQPRHKDTARRRSPGQREHNEACALPSYSLPYKCCSGNRPAGSWAVLLASRLHTPEARDHHTRATRPASTARVSPAQPWVQAPNTSALARHGDSLCQRRRQSSRNSLHHHDADSHCQFRPRHTSTH